MKGFSRDEVLQDEIKARVAGLRFMAENLIHSTRQRSHVERMLARAERRSRQAAKLVEKWKDRLARMDREGVAARQARLWADEAQELQNLPGKESEAGSLDLC